MAYGSGMSGITGKTTGTSDVSATADGPVAGPTTSFSEDDADAAAAEAEADAAAAKKAADDAALQAAAQAAADLAEAKAAEDAAAQAQADADALAEAAAEKAAAAAKATQCADGFTYIEDLDVCVEDSNEEPQIDEVEIYFEEAEEEPYSDTMDDDDIDAIIDQPEPVHVDVTVSVSSTDQDGICGANSSEYVAGETDIAGVGAWYYEYSDVNIIICWEEKLASELDKGNLNAKELLDNLESYQDEDLSMGSAPASPRRTFGTNTVSPVNGKTRQTAKVSATVPAGKSNISIHLFQTLDLSLINQKFGTNFPDEKKVLSFSSQTIRSGGKNLTTATTGEVSAPKSGETSAMAGHVHSYKLDAQGNGMTSKACSPEGICHSHKISNGLVQKAIGAQGAHVHIITGKQGKKTSVSNILLKDSSSLKKLSNTSISLTPLPSSELGSQTQEFSAARGLDGSASFIFDFDVVSALKHSPFGSIFSKDISSGVRREIISNARIISMEIIRKRVDIDSSVEEIIASSSQLTSVSLLAPQSKLIRDRNNKDGKLLGTISEVNMGSSDIRTFTGKDYSLPEEGKYEYTVKTTMTDAVVTYLNGKIKELTSAIKAAKKWSVEISNPTYSDTSRSSFSHKASRDIRKKYKNKNTPIENSLATYAEISSDVFGISTASEIINITYPMVNSVTGNSKGTDDVISAMEFLEKRMIEMLGTQLVSGQRSYEKTTSSGMNTSPKGILEFERSFNNQTLDMSPASGTGYIYIDDTGNDFGVSLVSQSGYNKRVDNELSAFSDKKIVSVPSEIKEMDVPSSSLTSLSNFSTNMTSYLTPSSIAVGGEVLDLSTSRKKWHNSNALNASDRLRNAEKEISSGVELSLDSFNDMGISFKISDNKSDNAGTFLVDDGDFGEIFTEKDAFVGENIAQDPFFETESLFNDSEELSKALFPALNIEQSEIQGEELQTTFDVVTGPDILSDMPTSEIRNLPFQAKSLFLSRSEDIKHNGLDDVSDTAAVMSSLESLVGVEVLSYEVDSKGNYYPQWSILTPTRLRQVGNLSLRCRVKRYLNSDLGIGQANDMSSAILNSDFIISGTNISSYRKIKRNQTQRQMKRYLSKQNRIIRGQIGSLSSISTGKK